jgi:SagB-type dehydrogenase family enzyme
MLRLLLPVLLIAAVLCPAQEPVPLPKPQMEGGMPLMQALKARQSGREFTPEKLSPQALSNLLWAAFGVNRPDSGKRTAPSASNRLEIDIYVTTADGAYVFDAKSHSLQVVTKEDLRGQTGKQPFVATAPVNLVYVADFAKMGKGTDENKVFYSAADTGFIAQNVYLFCASEGLATVVRGMIDREALTKALKLRPEQRAILAQTVGYTKK